MEKFRENRERIGEIVFFAGISIELFFMLYNLGSYVVPEWLNIGRLMQLASGLFLFKMIMTKYSPKEIAAIAVIIAIGIISFAKTGRDEWVLRVCLMIIASKEIDVKKVIKYVFYCSLVAFAIIAGLSLVGIGLPLVNVQDYGRGGIEARWTFGMGHPNHFQGFVCYMTSLGLLLYAEKVKWQGYVLLTILNFGLFFLTASRTGVLVTEVLIISFALYQKIRLFQKEKIWFGLSLFCIVFTFFFTLYAAKFGAEGPVLSKIDRIMTGRLVQLRWYADPDTWRLFSQSDEIGRAVVDVAYAALINAYGYVIGVLYCITTILLAIRLKTEKNIPGLIVLISCVLYGMMENYINSYFLLYNIIWILMMGRWNKFLKFTS